MFLSVPRSLLIVLCCSLFAPISTRAEELPSVSPAKLLMQVIDTVVEHHIEAPTRQQMVLDAIRFAAEEQGKVTPPGLSKQVSSADRATLERLLARALPPSPLSRVSNAGDFERVRKVAQAIVPGGIHMTSQADHRVQEQIAGNRYVGIGVTAEMHAPTKQLKFMTVVKGGAAEKAGAQDGDIVETVDGQPTQGTSIGQVIQWLRGEEGTDVIVTLRQPDEKESREYTMTRAVVPFETVNQPVYSQTQRVAVIGFRNLTGSTVHELRKIEEKLPETVEVVTLDFRHRGGFNLHHGILIANALIDNRPIGQIESTAGLRKVTAEPGALFGDRKLIAVINNNTSGTALWLSSVVEDSTEGGVTFGQSAQGALVSEGLPVADGQFVITLPTARLRHNDGSLLVARKARKGDSIHGLTVTRQPSIIGKIFQQKKLGNIEIEPILQQSSPQGIADTIASWYQEQQPISDEPKE